MRWPLIICSWALTLALPHTGLAQEHTDAETSDAETKPPIRSNNVLPLFDIVSFDFLLNRYGSRFIDRGTYDINRASIKRNLRTSWVLDNDPFSVNQFMHPYQGAMYHGFSRSAGLNYWESMGF